jgi:hypothetical protein
MARTYRIVIPLLAVWLLGWVFLSWPAIQDDALIHLRYADNLVRCHFITYDGVHRDYGASSLLYVALLASLREFSASANLARGVSSAVHVLLFTGLAWGFWSRGKNWGTIARLAALTLLVMIVLPGAVRWLDDGMETGIVAGFATVLAWLLHGESSRADGDGAKHSAIRFIAMVALGFFTVVLRTELSLLCGVGFLLLLVSMNAGRNGKGILAAGAGSAHLLLGAFAAIGLIYATMHTLLPDTALAKSHGIAHWFNPIHDTAVTLGGAMSFGAGMLIFWLITLTLVLMRRGISLKLLLANCFFPVVLALAALRGQEIQGVRYFAWTFFFAIVWNILELGSSEAGDPRGRWLVYGFLVLLAIELPFEAIAMHRVLTHRGEMMREFEAEQLSVLRGEKGIASDIGYVGYFTGAKICDLAGLVNGREAARLSSLERAHACVETNPDFIFANVSQLAPLARMMDLSQWKVCGRYEFTNVTTPDTHYLVVRPEVAPAACSARARSPEPLESILAAAPVAR